MIFLIAVLLQITALFPGSFEQVEMRESLNHMEIYMEADLALNARRITSSVPDHHRDKDVFRLNDRHVNLGGEAILYVSWVKTTEKLVGDTKFKYNPENGRMLQITNLADKKQVSQIYSDTALYKWILFWVYAPHIKSMESMFMIAHEKYRSKTAAY